MVLLAGLAGLAGACTEELGERCRGQTIERWRSGNLSGGRWEVEATCSTAAGEVCKVFQVASHNYPNHAYCTSGAPDPACRGMTGRFCAAGGSLMVCVQGYRVSGRSGLAYFERCPSYAPRCYEPTAGAAFCVETLGAAGECAGRPARKMDWCAADHAACGEASFVQACVDATTSVTCLDGVLLRRVDCAASGGTCVETGSVETHPCVYGAGGDS